MSETKIAHEGQGAHGWRDALLAALVCVAVVLAMGLAGRVDAEADAAYAQAVAMGEVAR